MRGPPAVIAAVAVGAAALPALAAGERTTTARGTNELAPAAVTITAQSTNKFEPASVTIAVG
jgi:plastocyanin